MREIKFNRPPSNIEERYREKLLEFLNYETFNCKALRKAKTELELQFLYINELSSRFSFLSTYCDEYHIDIKLIKNCTSFIDFNDIDKSLNFAKDYYMHTHDVLLNNRPLYTLKNISLKEFLCEEKSFWKDADIKNIESLIDIPKYDYSFYDNSAGRFFQCKEGMEIYFSIKNDLKSYIKNNIEEYKKICKNHFNTRYNENKVSYSELFLDEKLEYKILTDIEITIEYLKKANLIQKYFPRLQKSYQFNKKMKKIVTNSDNEIYCKKSTIPCNININFNLPLEVIKKEIENIYKLVHKTKEENINIIFNEERILSDKIKIFDEPGNKSAIKNLFKKEFNCDSTDLRIKIEYLIMKLFNFDCLFLALLDDQVEKLIKKRLDPEELYDVNSLFLSRKNKHYDELLDLIVNQKYNEYLVGYRD